MENADTQFMLAAPDVEQHEMENADTQFMLAPPDVEQHEMENGDTQLMLTPPELPDPAQPTPAVSPVAPAVPPEGVSAESMIMAVVCAYGHHSPQNASSCRICGSPIAPQGPRLVPRPVLAVLRASDGTTAAVDRVVLIGRAPSANRSTARAPRLMTVHSPGHDISRTHVEVCPEGWQVAVTDLNSTNGTVLHRPGAAGVEVLGPGTAAVIPLGSVLELGDGVSVVVDFP